MRRFLSLLLSATLVVISAPAAMSVTRDFFDNDASGNAVYEAMVIHPEALYDAEADKTYIAYQGFAMDPYVAAYDHGSGVWEGPVRVGDNPLTQDFHGGPSLVIDASGRIHAFYGCHNSDLKHSMSLLPHDISGWWEVGSVKTGSGSSVKGTYPQPMNDVDGDLLVFFRATDGSWRSIESTAGAPSEWGSPKTVIGTRKLDGKAIDSWYAHFRRLTDGSIDCAFHFRDIQYSDMYERWDLLYMRRDTAGTWRNVKGEPVTGVTKPTLYDECLVWDSGAESVNQQVVVEHEGVPHILFLAGDVETETPVFDWRIARWEASATVEGSGETTSTWLSTTITSTDDFFDAADLETRDGRLAAYLTTGGNPDPQAVPGQKANRGGDITRWEPVGPGGEWRQTAMIMDSSELAVRYNDPQVVRNGHADARLFFSEWNNDGANYVHKVYLWGDAGFLQREFTPEAERLAGRDRVATAIEVSKRAFPTGAETVFVASKSAFPDVLCGVPLAHANRAPILLVGPELEGQVSTEIDRLLARAIERTTRQRIVILGGEAAVSASVERSLRDRYGWSKVSRIGGTDRYDTARLVAEELRDLRGTPSRVVLASGEDFPDALVVSPLAARRGWPVLLTPSTRMAAPTTEALRSSGATEGLMVGSERAVSDDVKAGIEKVLGGVVERVGGRDRYETAGKIAALSVDSVSGDTLSPERLVIATGQDFPDGLAGGVLAARFRASMLIVPKTLSANGTLPYPVEAFVLEHRNDVLDAYFLGGPPAIDPSVQDRVMSGLLSFGGVDGVQQ